MSTFDRRRMAVFYQGRSTFEHKCALDAPLSILAWTFMSIEALQTYFTSCLSTIKLDQEFNNVEDGMTQLLAHGKRTWWDREVARVLDTLIREYLTECLALLAGLHQQLVATDKKSKDYKEDRGSSATQILRMKMSWRSKRQCFKRR